MYLRAALVALFLSLEPVIAGVAAPVDVQRRENPALEIAEAIIVALNASPFCSAFVPITNSTSTVTITPTSSTTTISTTLPPCTVTAPTSTITTMETDTTTTTADVTTTVSSAALPKRAVHLMTSASLGKTTNAFGLPVTFGVPKLPTMTIGPTPIASALENFCTASAVPFQIQMFPCEVVTSACLAVVTPQTVTTTTTLVASTISITTTSTPVCDTITPSTTVTQTQTVTQTTTSVSTSVCPQPGFSNGIFDGYTMYAGRIFPGITLGGVVQGVYSEQACASMCDGLNGCSGYTWYGQNCQALQYSPGDCVVQVWAEDGYNSGLKGGPTSEP